MTWISVTVSAYLLGAVAVLLDKFLLGSKRIASAQTYAFYIGIFGMGTLLLAPLGFLYPSMRLSVPSINQIWLSMVSGILYMAGIATLYAAIKRAEAGRVTPVVFSVVPIATYIIALVLKSEHLSGAQVCGVGLLIIGGLLISFDLPLTLGKKKFFSGFYLSCLSGVFFAVAYVLFKFVYAEQHFFNGFVWTRAGAFVGALGLLLVPAWRKAITKSLANSKRPTRKHVHTGGIFVANKIIGGSSSIMINYALSIGSVTLVNAMVSLQYVFLLGMLWLVSKKYHHIFQEKLLFWDWAQKVTAIVIIGIGVYFVSGV